jgi:hypothetical protein
VKKKSINYLGFEVDKLTRSIENVATGDSFETEISVLTKADLKTVSVKNGWLFNWVKELKLNDREVYKLTIQNNPAIIQGLVSFSIQDNYVYMPLIESAPFNRGRGKVYLGVPGNMVAYGCRLSFQKGFGGFLSFHSKTKLVQHYAKTLGAVHVGAHLMVINPAQAQKLVEHYFKT